MVPLTLLVLAAFGESVSWYAVRNLASSDKESATLAGNYYGTYGNDLSILSALGTEVATGSYLIESLPLHDQGHLYVFEVHNLEGVTKVEDFLNDADVPAKIIYASSTECIVQVSDSELRLSLSSDSAKSFKNMISIPMEPYRPVKQKYHYPIVTEPDPRIQAALDLVTIQSLNDTITYLAMEIWSRNSASVGAVRAQTWFVDQLLGMDAHVSTFPFDARYSYNVIAEFPSALGITSPAVVVGAHYDSRSTNASNVELRAPGAVDNASGSAGVLELARVIAQSKFRFRYPLRLMWFSGEEQGLLGSRAYARSLPAGSVLAMLNADMLAWPLGGVNGTKIYTLGFKDRFVDPELVASCVSLTNTYLPQLLTANSSSCCSDYQSFYEQGFPSAGFFQNQGSASDYPKYHTSEDLPDQVDWTQQQLETQAVIAAALTYAEIQ